MKKGCFLSALVILTILIGAAIYIVRNHSKNVEKTVVTWVKPFVIKNMYKEADEKLQKINDPVYKDTLKAIVRDYISVIEKSDSFDLNQAQDFQDELNTIFHHSRIDSANISQLTKYLNKEKSAYERSEKNGN